jgi:predicted secreted protein
MSRTPPKLKKFQKKRIVKQDAITLTLDNKNTAEAVTSRRSDHVDLNSKRDEYIVIASNPTASMSWSIESENPINKKSTRFLESSILGSV